jgi:hypothetical protein
MAEPEGDEAAGSTLSDTPIPDRLWDGLLAWMRGTFAVIGTALAVSATLGWPRRPAAALTGAQLGFLAVQAAACSGFVVRSGRRLCRRIPGALAVAFAAGVPATLVVLMAAEWRDPREPIATWASLLVGSLRLAAIEAVPVGYLLWSLTQRPLRWGGAGSTPDVG